MECCDHSEEVQDLLLEKASSLDMIPLTIRMVYRQAEDPSRTSGGMLLCCAERLRNGDGGTFRARTKGQTRPFERHANVFSGFPVCDKSTPIQSFGFTNPGKVGTMVLGADSRSCAPQPSLTHLHR